MNGLRRLRPLLSVPIFLWAAALAQAEPTVTAHVSATETTVGNPIFLSIEIAGVSNAGGQRDLQLPDFDVQRAGQTHSFQWINGQSSSLTTFNYQLTPTKAGTLQIPPIALQADGKTYTSQPITVSVAPEGAAVPGPGATKGSGNVTVPSEGLRPLFMTASVDTDHAYVGQQILLRVQFLHRPDVDITSQPRYSEPDTTGFIVEPLPQQQYTTTINGTPYQVTELPYALFPTSDGSFAIGSAQIEVAVRSQVDPFDPNSFFQSFFGRSQVAKLTTRAIPVSVRALPKNKPADFSGAVGRYHIAAKVDGKEFEVGKPFNLIVTVEGTGNIKALKEPTFPDLKGFRRYETISSAKTSNDDKLLSGTKEFKVLLIPQVSGQITIPPVSFIYFNPSEAEFVTVQTDPIPLSIKPGQVSADATPEAVPASAQAAESVRVVEKDIRFIKSGPVVPQRPPLYERAAFLAANALPPLFALAAFIVNRRSRLRRERAAEFRVRSAAKRAKAALSGARKKLAAADQSAFYGAVNAALAQYVADKLGLSAAGLLWDDVDRRLADRKVPAETRQRLRETVDDTEMARFAPSSFEADHRAALLGKSEEVVAELEELL